MEVDNLNRKLQAAEANEVLMKEIEEQRNALLEQLSQRDLMKENFEKILEDFRNDALHKMKEHETTVKKLLDQISMLQKKNDGLQDRLNQVTENLLAAQRLNAELGSKMSSLEQIVVLHDDMNKQLKMANQTLQQAVKDKESLRQQVDMGAEYIINQDEKSYDLQKLIIYLKGVISEKDEYINNLKKLIIEMKEKSAIYVPVRDDPIDRRLAEYLNSVSDPNKLKVLFIRESEGVYQFGNKRVYVKVEMDKVMIRVGGGYLSIDEFLEKHVPIELERIARNDPIKLLTNNLAVHKTISGRSVNEMERPKTTGMPVKESLLAKFK
jgi:hypothetical protein